MITAPDRLLHRLEWQVLRRLDGRIQGGVRTTRRGSGLDFAGLRAYVEGDDARHIDWNVTARLDEPQLREFTEDRELTSWLVLDRSASMGERSNPDATDASNQPGKSDASGDHRSRSKADVAAELALVLSRLLGRNGNRVGAVLYDDAVGASPAGVAGSTRAAAAGVSVIMPGSGRNQALRIGRELQRPAGPRTSATTDLGAMLDVVSTLARRSLVVVISDLIGTGEWERPLIRLAHRNEVVALRVVDSADDALPAVGLIVVEDAETGEQLLVDSADPWFRARFRDGVELREAELRSGTRRAGVPLHRVEVAGDLVDTVIAIVAETRRAGVGGRRR